MPSVFLGLILSLLSGGDCFIFPIGHGSVVPKSSNFQTLLAPQTQSLTLLAALPQNKNETSESGGGDGFVDSITAPGLLVGDMFAILIACQQIGLVDVLSDDGFWKAGGWFQPIDAITSTRSLPTLINRFSKTGIAWLTAAIIGKGLAQEAVRTPELAIKTALKLMLPYAIALASAEFASVYLAGQQPVPIEICRLFYFTGIALTAARYVSSSIFN
jgi:hypothetical protein